MSTSFEQFRASLANPYARSSGLRLQMSDSEAQRIISDEALARAYYENWLRTPREPRSPNASRPVAAPAAAPRVAPAPTYAGTVAPEKKRKIGCFGITIIVLLIVVAIIVIVNVAANADKTQSAPSSTTSGSSSAESAPVESVVSAAQQRDEEARDQGWEVAVSGELYVRARDTDDFTCGYFACIWYEIKSTSGCPNGVYLRADIASSGRAVGWTNAISASIPPGETVDVELQDAQGLGNQFRVTEANCM